MQAPELSLALPFSLLYSPCLRESRLQAHSAETDMPGLPLAVPCCPAALRV